MTKRSLWKRLSADPPTPHIAAPFDLHAANGAIFDIHALKRSDRGASEATIRGLCRHAFLGEGTALARVLGRYKMFVDTRDVGLTPHLLLDGFWEMWHTEAMVERVKPGMTAIDAGANLGYFSLLLADLVGSTGSVHAFEPNPAMARHLRDTMEINGFGERTTIHEAALSDTDGTANLWVPEGQPKNANIIAASGRAGDIEVPTRRLDSYADLLDTDFIKIDVEGEEEKLWEGMAGLIAQNRPLTIFLEFTGKRYKSPGAFVDRLMAHDFEMGVIDHDAGIIPLDRETLLAQSPNDDQLVVLTR